MGLSKDVSCSIGRLSTQSEEKKGNNSALLSESQTPKVYTVSQLTEEIRDLLEQRFEFVWVEGEVSNFTAPVSGHYYMSLKDERSQIRTVMFRLQARYLKFLPENGMKVIAQGRISVYAPRGEYQIILDYLEPMGVGALALAFEQLKSKLAAQGVFDEAVKKTLPYLPQRVAVITSPTGAAIRDFLKVIHRRFANLEITVVPVRVQGEGATAEIVEALDRVNRVLDVDVIVLTRGGGSLEDLWAFNQEALALAIRRSSIPVVSAVGHEIDLTISDLAADFRAPTPSAAAELLVVEKDGLVKRLDEMRNRMISGLRILTYRWGQDLDRMVRGLRDPRKRFAEFWMRLDEIHSRMRRQADIIITEGVNRLEAGLHRMVINSPMKIVELKGQRLLFQGQSLMKAITRCLDGRQLAVSLRQERLGDLSPLSILKRGYSITRKLPDLQVLKEASAVERGARIQVLLARGQLECQVEEVEPILDGGLPRRTSQ